ncbi:MAG: hypothetical protein ACRCZE_00415 [Candidatus Altimarinota bacterium]
MKNLEQLKQLQQQLKNELERSVLVEPEDRDYWLAQLPELNLVSIQHLLEAIAPANATVDSYVDTALAQDQNQEHLIALRAKFDQIKRTALQLEEKSSNQTELSQSEDLLKQLDQIK